MNGPVTSPTREEVLDSFAAEPHPGRETLERYLNTYPAYAADLVDLAWELSRPVAPDDAALYAADLARIDAAWHIHLAPAPRADPVPDTVPDHVTDPFASLSVDGLRTVARNLGVPRQVLTAFRDRRVDVASVPSAFLARMAAAVQSTREAIIATLERPSAVGPAWSYKSDAKPSARELIPFERLLRDAGVPDADRAELLREDG